MSIPKTQRDLNISDVLQHGDMIGAPDLATKIAKRGGTVQDLYREYLDRGTVPNPDKMLGLSQTDTRGYSICDLITSIAEGNASRARNERDLSGLVTAKTGKVANGEFIPLSVFARDFNAGTAGEAGNLLGADRLGALAGDPLRKIFTLGQLGATFFSGLKSTAAVPVFESVTAAAYLTETGQATNILQTSRLVTLTPRRLAVVFVMSRQALIQATPELEAATKRQMAAAINEAMQQGILAGDGAGQNPTGILNDANVGIEVGGVDGATLTFAHLVDMEYMCANGNNPNGSRGWVINPGTAKYLRTKARATGLPEILGNDGQILGAQQVVTNTMPGNLTKGSGTSLNGLVYSNDWSQLLIGIYGGGVDLTVDRVTLADQGKLRVVASLEFGFGMRQPSAFAIMRDAKLV